MPGWMDWCASITSSLSSLPSASRSSSSPTRVYMARLGTRLSGLDTSSAVIPASAYRRSRSRSSGGSRSMNMCTSDTATVVPCAMELSSDKAVVREEVVGIGSGKGGRRQAACREIQASRLKRNGTQHAYCGFSCRDRTQGCRASSCRLAYIAWNPKSVPAGKA